MRRRTPAMALAGATLITLAALIAVATPTAAAGQGPKDLRIAREVLPDGDGWGSAGSGTTGGSTASGEHIYEVSSRQELLDALAAGGDAPKIVFVDGVIDMNTDADGNHLDCQDYYPGYSFEAYVRAAADPDSEEFRRLEAARDAAAERELDTITVEVTSNTTLIGRDGGTLLGASVVLDQVRNVILRNLTVKDTLSCFPQFTGDEWVAEGFDAVSLSGATNVWVDHVTIDGGIVEPEPFFLGFQLHRSDGLLDVVRASDLVTVSWSVLRDGDKAVLIGNSDSRITDRGHLRVTLHHNLFQNLVERAPRVRFGQVHAYNNHHDITDARRFSYSWGVGVESKLYVEAGAVTAVAGITPDRLVRAFGGTAIHIGTTLFNRERVDVLAAYNQANDPDLGSGVGWAPTLYGERHPAQAVPALVRARAGAGHLL